MNRENLKMKSHVGLVLEDEASAKMDALESYQREVRARSERARPAIQVTAEGERKQALPAWIKAQVEQLEMRRKARHLAAQQGPAVLQEHD